MIVIKPSCCLISSDRLSVYQGLFYALTVLMMEMEQTRRVKILLLILLLHITELINLRMIIQKWLNRKLRDKIRLRESAKERGRKNLMHGGTRAI